MFVRFRGSHREIHPRVTEIAINPHEVCAMMAGGWATFSPAGNFIDITPKSVAVPGCTEITYIYTAATIFLVVGNFDSVEACLR